jgi:hypothetical protein
VGDTIVEYSRSGSGRPIVLLGFPSRSSLRTGLSERFKLVVPESAPTPDFSGWLRSFLDGLGLTLVDLVADGFAVPVMKFAQLEPERVNRVVLMSVSPGEQAELDSLHQARDGQPATPLLIVRPGEDSDAVVEQIVQFLDGEL